MELNIKNMPVNTIYRFDVNRYIMSTLLTESRDGSHKFNEPTACLEVYKIDDDGALTRMASGTLFGEYESSHTFAIKDYDKDMVISFKVPMYMQEVSLEELYELRSAISKNYNKKHKN